MPLTQEAIADSLEFQERKIAQWQKFAAPGLQLVRAANKTQWMLIYSVPEFYEGVVIGQLERRETEVKMVARKKTAVDLPNNKKSIEKRGIDLSDDQVAKIVERWKAGKSAKSLKFVSCVWGRDGEPVES